MAFVAKHYVPGKNKMYTPGEIIRETLHDANRLICLGAIEPLDERPVFMPEPEDNNANTAEQTAEDTDMNGAADEPEEAAEDMAEAPVMDAMDSIVDAGEPQKTTRRRAARQ